MIRTTRAVALSVAAVAALSGIAACGSKTVAPQQQLDNSFSGLGNSSSLSATIRVALAPADLTYYANQPNDDGSKDSAADVMRAEKLLPTSSFVITTASDNGKRLKDLGTGSKDANVDFVFNLDGKPDLDIKSIAKTKTAYIRANVSDLATEFGGNFAQIQQEAASAPPSLAFVKPALANQYLSLDLGSLEALAKQFPGSSGTGGTGGVPSINPSQASAAEAQLIDSLERDVTATQGASSTLGNHLVLTANSKAVVTDLVNALNAAVPAALKNMIDKDLDLSKVPSRPVTLDEYTKNGTLSALSINLAQFATGKGAAEVKGHPIPLEIDFATSAPAITAPASSTPINLMQIVQSFAGLAGGLGSVDSGTATAIPVPSASTTS